MKLLLPTIEVVPPGKGYAVRPAKLDGLRVGFLDGWGNQTAEGVEGMYPAMAEIERRLREESALGETVWQMKPSISNEVPPEMLAEFAVRVDVVVNGEGL